MCTFTNRRLLPTYLWPGENGCNARVRDPADALNTSDTGDSLKQSTILTTAANHLFITLAVSLAESVKHWSGVCLFRVGPSVLFGKNRMGKTGNLLARVLCVGIVVGNPACSQHTFRPFCPRDNIFLMRTCCTRLSTSLLSSFSRRT